MEIEFIENGESPEIGVFSRGERRDLPEDIARAFIQRKIAKPAISTTAQKQSKKGVEVSDG